MVLFLLVIVGYYIINSQASGGPIYQFGMRGDVPAPMDILSDGNDELVIWRPSNGIWYIKDITTGAYKEVGWGINGDRPFAFYPGRTAKANIMIYRPSNATWYIRDVATGVTSYTTYGNVGDKPVPGDYDRDGITDLAVWQKYNGTPNGTLAVRASHDGQIYKTLNVPASTYDSNYWDALSSDVLMVGNQLAFPSTGNNFGTFTYWRPSTATWKMRNFNGAYNQLGSVTNEKTVPNWGKSGDIPFTADFSRDGVDDLALFRPSNGFWYIKNGTSIGTNATGANTSFQYGTAEDIPFAFMRSTDPANPAAKRYASPAFFRPKSGRWYIAINLKAR